MANQRTVSSLGNAPNLNVPRPEARALPVHAQYRFCCIKRMWD
jgi:hypothetical protein